MAVLNLKESQIRNYYELIRPELERKLEARNKLNLEIEDDYEIIKQLEAVLGIAQNELIHENVRHFKDGYSSDMVWINKIAHVIRVYGSKTTGEIVDFIITQYEPDLDRQSTVKTVSALLGQNTGEGKRFNKYLNKRNENVYSLQVESKPTDEVEDDLPF